MLCPCLGQTVRRSQDKLGRRRGEAHSGTSQKEVIATATPRKHSPESLSEVQVGLRFPPVSRVRASGISLGQKRKECLQEPREWEGTAH